MYKKCFVRVFDRHGVVLVQFEIDYFEATKNWTFDDDESRQELTKEFDSNKIITVNPSHDEEMKEKINRLQRENKDQEHKIQHQATRLEELNSMLQSLLIQASVVRDQRNVDTHVDFRDASKELSAGSLANLTLTENENLLLIPHNDRGEGDKKATTNDRNPLNHTRRRSTAASNEGGSTVDSSRSLQFQKALQEAGIEL
jgi:hypothetical protein